MTIRILETGGTIDKEYDQIGGKLALNKKHLQEMFARSNVTTEFTIESLELVDSLEMTNEERQQIVHKCEDCKEKSILISHGTDTMIDTARFIAEKSLDKTIVLFGAMIPYTMANSDSLFNLGFAFCAVQELSSGVYIVMNGKVFPWDNVRKNQEKGIFEQIN